MDYVLLALGLFGCVGVVAYSIKRYLSTNTTAFWTAFENSASVAMGRVVTAVGGLWTALVHYLETNADVLSSQHFSGLVQFMLDQKWAGLILLFVGFLLDIVHSREVQKLPPGSPSNNG